MKPKPVRGSRSRRGCADGNGGYSLYLFGPFWRVAKGHEYTVRQNGTHDDHAE